MGILSKVVKNNGTEVTLQYPVLMEDVETGSVVRFSSLVCGTVMHATEHWPYNIGDQHGVWMRATNTVVWKKFTGTLEMSNESCNESCTTPSTTQSTAKGVTISHIAGDIISLQHDLNAMQDRLGELEDEVSRKL